MGKGRWQKHVPLILQRRVILVPLPLDSKGASAIADAEPWPPLHAPALFEADSKVQAWVGSHVWDSAIRLSNYLDSDYIPSGTLVGKTVCEVRAFGTHAGRARECVRMTWRLTTS